MIDAFRADLSGRIYLRPDGMVVGRAAGALMRGGTARLFSGGPSAFTIVDILRRCEGAVLSDAVPVGALRAALSRTSPQERARLDDILTNLSGARDFCGLDLVSPRIMGIVNVTPDSFSDGGDFFDPTAAIAHGRALLAEGANILDVGGESTQPGASAPSEIEELRRIVPVVEALAAEGALVSVDTRRASVMRAALAAGARIVNDITALTGDPESLGVAAESGAGVVLMHMQGEPATMQQDPRYDHAPTEIFDYLAARVAACRAAGIPLERVAVDPGIGFGKTVAHNLQLLNDLALFAGLGCAVLVGVSRKGFLGRIAGVPEAKERLPGSLAAGLLALDRGAGILRVHDVAATRQAILVRQAMLDPG